MPQQVTKKDFSDLKHEVKDLKNAFKGLMKIDLVDFKTSTEDNFQEMRTDFQEMKDDMKGLRRSMRELIDVMQTFAHSVDERFEKTGKRLNRVEALMVTKDYLDEKLGVLKGDMISATRRMIRTHEAQFHGAV